VTVSSFAVAGALFLFFFSIEMILGIQLFKESAPETASIVPLAFPLVAGAGSLTTILSLRAQYGAGDVIIGIVLNLLLVYVVLKYSEKIEEILGKNGISIIRKIFGIILLAIAIQIFTANIKSLF
jgi:multiple antibiotic resistance protein